MSDSKEHILSTSLLLFLQKSFKEVTLRDIVEKTGMSKGAFYHYFKSKDQVFAEVINYFFAPGIHVDFSDYPQQSLMAFYEHTLEQSNKFRTKLTRLIGDYQLEGTNNNHYYLLFDAIRLLPGFKEANLQQKQKEQEVWEKVVAQARKNGEIKTQLTDEIIAKLFIHLGDGTNINLIFSNELTGKRNELRILWNNLYDSLKA